jgi:[amino group carrier protein]-L-2-aminoadipate 6-kinase
VAAGDLDGYQARVTGGMRRKLMGASEALRGGVRQVVLADGRVTDAVTAALVGRGTVIA